MNNIPQKILQYIADEAFAQSSSSPLWCVRNGTNWKHQPNTRRAVIQHALDNPALAPFLADPAAQVSLGPEDCPPGSTLRAAQGHWFIVLHVEATGVTISNVNGSRFIEWHELKDEGWQINISRPDTGRWDENAWRPCSKPAGKEVAK